MISARIADGITKTKHNKRREMLGLGLANIASGLAGGIPATAALARTALNIKTGATDKIAATISSICIALISLLLISFFKYIPMAAIAAMLVFVSIKMVEKEHFLRMLRVDKKNFILSLFVALVTIYEDPIIGLLLGATIGTLIFMESISKGHYQLQTVTTSSQKKQVANSTSQTMIYAIKGELAYINAQSHIAQLEQIPAHYKNVIIDLRGLHFIDLDGIEAFSEIVDHLHQLKETVAVANVRPFIFKMLHESHEFNHLQEKGLVFTSTEQALEKLNA